MKKLFFIFGLIVAFVSANAVAAGDYVLGKDDVIKIAVYDHPDLTTEVQIGGTGTISFPLIGQVKAAGNTPKQLEIAIEGALKNGGYVKNPNVNVVIAAYRSQRLSVLGEVNRPGRFTLENETSLQDALAMAGGVSPVGGDRVVLIRGKNSKEVRLQEYLMATEREMIQNGDVLYVPRAEQVYVYGEVNRPGVYRIEPGLTVIQAIINAGGFTAKADEDDVEVTSKNPQKEVKTVKASANDPVKDGDVLKVGESLF